jgi:hypothetical protein
VQQRPSPAPYDATSHYPVQGHRTRSTNLMDEEGCLESWEWMSGGVRRDTEATAGLPLLDSTILIS